MEHAACNARRQFPLWGPCMYKLLVVRFVAMFCYICDICWSYRFPVIPARHLNCLTTAVTSIGMHSLPSRGRIYGLDNIGLGIGTVNDFTVIFYSQLKLWIELRLMLSKVPAGSDVLISFNRDIEMRNYFCYHRKRHWVFWEELNYDKHIWVNYWDHVFE